MKNGLRKFDFKGNLVRTITLNDEPWFIAKDVCDVLEISNPTVTIGRLDEEEVTKLNLGGLVGKTNFINESGLYSLILGSRKPEAKVFKKWVTSKVLPSLRKHGMYAKDELLDNPELLLDTVKKLIETRKEKELIERRLEFTDGIIKEQTPKAEYHDEVLTSKSCFNTTTIAKELGMSAVRLNKKLHKEGIIYYTNQHWVLYAKYQHLNYTKTRTTTINRSIDKEDTTRTVIDTLWTEKGRKFIHNLFGERI